MYEQYLPDIDVNDGIRRVVDHKLFYFKLLKRFDARGLVNEMITEIKKGTDTNAIAEMAHAFKGTASNLALTKLTQTAHEIIVQTKEGMDCNDKILALENALLAYEKQLEKLFMDENFSG